MRASLQRLFFGANLKEQPLCRSVYYCWLKPARQSSTLELTRIVEELFLGHILKFFFHADVEMHKTSMKRLYKIQKFP